MSPVLHFTGGVGKIRESSDNAIKQATLRPENSEMAAIVRGIRAWCLFSRRRSNFDSANSHSNLRYLYANTSFSYLVDLSG
jgi:hypothetical protein